MCRIHLSFKRNKAVEAAETSVVPDMTPNTVGGLYELEDTGVPGHPPASLTDTLELDSNQGRYRISIISDHREHDPDQIHPHGITVTTTISHATTLSTEASRLAHALLFAPPTVPALPFHAQPIPSPEPSPGTSKRPIFVLCMEAGSTWVIPVYSPSSSTSSTPRHRRSVPVLTVTIPQNERGDQFKDDLAKTGSAATGSPDGNMFGLSRQQRTTRKAGRHHRRSKSAGAVVESRVAEMAPAPFTMSKPSMPSPLSSVPSARPLSTLTLRTKSEFKSLTPDPSSPVSALTPMFPPRPMSLPLSPYPPVIPPVPRIPAHFFTSQSTVSTVSSRRSATSHPCKPRYYTTSLTLIDKIALSQREEQVWTAKDVLRHYDARKMLLPKNMDKLRKVEFLSDMEAGKKRTGKTRGAKVEKMGDGVVRGGGKLVKVMEE